MVFNDTFNNISVISWRSVFLVAENGGPGENHRPVASPLEEFEDTKGVIRIRKSKKNRQHNGQKKNDKRTSNNLQNTAHKTKDRITRTPLKK
jgi:hypothetical protein